VVCFPLPALSEQQQHAAETPPCSWCAGWDLNEVYVHLHLLCCTFSVKLRGSHGPKYMHICSTDGLGWMGVQLWRSEWQHSIHWGSTPPKQAFTRDPEGPRQVTPKLSCSPLQATQQEPLPPAPTQHCRLHETSSTFRPQNFNHNSGLFLSSIKTTDDARKEFRPFWLWASFPCSVQSATEGNTPPRPTAIHLFLRFYNR